MTSTRFLRFALPAVLVPAAIAVALPGEQGVWYARVAQPGVLFFDALLAFWVASMYREHLQIAFVGIGLFLLFYGLISAEPVVAFAVSTLGSKFLWALVAYQVFSYLLLFVGCLSVLRAVGVTRLNRTGWLVVAAGAAVALAIVAGNLPEFRQGLAADRLGSTLVMLVRVFDAIVIVMLLPVLLLYTQNAKAKYQESATFSLTMMGVIGSLSLVYVYEFVRQQPLAVIAKAEYQHGSLLDALYLVGYFLVAVGLFAHRMHQRWSLQAMDSLLIAESPVVDRVKV